MATTATKTKAGKAARSTQHAAPAKPQPESPAKFIERNRLQIYLKQLDSDEVADWYHRWTGVRVTLRHRRTRGESCEWAWQKPKGVVDSLSNREWNRLRDLMVEHKEIISDLTLEEAAVFIRRWMPCSVSCLRGLVSELRLWRKHKHDCDARDLHCD